MNKHKKMLKKIGMESDFFDWKQRQLRPDFTNIPIGTVFSVTTGPYTGKKAKIEKKEFRDGELSYRTTLMDMYRKEKDDNVPIYLYREHYNMIKIDL